MIYLKTYIFYKYLYKSTPFPHENPCYLARFFFYKNLSLLAVFSWFYRATDIRYQFIDGQSSSHNSAISLAW